MVSERLPRKLVAIFYADVAEYSRLTGEDEDGTHRRLSAYLDLIAESIRGHRGRVMHYAGDAVLAVFEAIVDALNCAVRIQDDLRAHNANLPDHRKVQFRIGINMGDVIEDRDDVYGDGVNVAARLEELAEPGGICVSEPVHLAIGNKPPFDFQSLGEKHLKNIDEPIRLYRVEIGAGIAPAKDAGQAASPARSKTFATGAILGVAAAIILAWWQPWTAPEPPDTSDIEARSTKQMPSIAVLPFLNIGDDPEQEYFADGITDDLITDLSKISGLFVIARNSSFAYKGKSPDVRKVAQDLDVTHVLEGSIRRIGELVRINAQLIDGKTGRHLWAERYEGALVNLFELQDRVNGNIVAAMKVRLTPEERVATTDRGTTNLQAYDAFLRGWAHLQRKTPEDAYEATRLFTRAVELDPAFGRAYAAMAQTYWDYSVNSKFVKLTGFNVGHGTRSDIMVKEDAWKFLRKAQAQPRPSSQTHALAARLLQRQRAFDEAMLEARRAVALGPNDPLAYDVLIGNLVFSGEIREALRLADESIALDPSLPGEKLLLKGLAEYASGRLNAALTLVERARAHNPSQFQYAVIQAAALVELGRVEEAKRALQEYLDGVEGYTTLNWTMLEWPFKDRETARRLATSLMKAGLPKPLESHYAVMASDRLTGEQIRRLVAGKTMVGRDDSPGGEGEFKVIRDEEVQIIGQGYVTYFKDGKTAIKGDLLCDPWWSFEEFCVAIYRNRTGSREAKSEYLFFTLSGAITFSLFDEG